jgi:regulator of protease activity HflC (stomatin/prohibitin superfamily)
MTTIEQIRQILSNLFQWWVTIAPWQQGVRIRFGKHTKLLQPGVHFKLPLFDSVYMQPIRLRAQYVESQTLTTSDGKTLSLAAAIQYEITDLLTLYRTLHNAHDTIGQQVQGELASYVYAHRLDELKPSNAEKFLADTMDLSQYGLRVHKFKLTNFAVVRTYRLISGEIGSFTGYDQRIETTLPMGERRPQ